MDIRRAFSIAWLAFGLLALLLSANALGHPGGLDRNGCHTNRKTGDYHCHRGAPAAPRYVDTPRSSFAPGSAR
ncbi:YHYH domain-containing protein, partial [Desulfovibrio sulfodismutans]